jgi:hypothetical protein
VSETTAVSRPRKQQKRREESEEGLECNEAWYGKFEANGGVVATCRLAITSRGSAIDGVLDTLPKRDELKKGVMG